jgi:hypothetical protein
MTKPFEIRKTIDIELWKELNEKQLVLFQNKNITNSNDLYVTVKATDLYSASAFFNTLKRKGKVDVKLALSSPEDKKLSFKGKMIFINDQEGSDKKIKTYGDEDYIILVFNYNGEVKLLCLFKYKL